MRYYGTHLIELFGFFAIELFKFGHGCNPPWTAALLPPPIDPLDLKTASQGLGFQPKGQYPPNGTPVQALSWG
jgi:hypothetical protein